MKTKLAQILINIKVANARINKHRQSEIVRNGEVEQLGDACTELYRFLETKNVSQIERLCQ